MYEKELQFARDIAYKAGEIIKNNFVAIGGTEKIWKYDNSPVTETDLAINKMVLEGIQQAFPGHSLLGEEESSETLDTEFVWVCDPVDGTIPFSHGLPTSCFTLALCRDGVPVLGIGFDPYMNRMYWAIKGEGAFVNETRIQVSGQATFDKGYININKWQRSLYDIYPALGKLQEIGVESLEVGSCIYAGCLVASGQFLANVFPGKTAWDIAALKVIVEEAGGKVTDFHGQDQRYDREINGAIISNGLVHEQLVEFFTKYGKKRE